MSEWDGTGDQYHNDVDSRYPLFSDMQTTDYSINTVPRPVKPREVRSYESKYQYEQQDIPAILSCKCGSCPMREWPRGNPPLRKLTVDQRDALLQMQHDAIFGHHYAGSQGALSPMTAPVMVPTGPMMAGSMMAGPMMAGSMMAGAATPWMHLQSLPGQIDSNTLMLLFLFIIVVVICVACMKSIGDLKESMRQIIDKK